ncbi:MAG: tetratricopeptide repeat protein [Saprospiraceae bacterium]|nr:MAG: Tetratricopeptide repeat protein [Bacteroidetes bacterium OLB9]MCO6463885.1 tetratricopeptide repeat protein [Saprospiraceae bacterium]MCZ2338752.1 tetratricopeptide repeat protein [Chitinophagales bacterium]
MNTDRLNTLLSMYNEDPEDSFVRFALAKEYEKLGDINKALQHYVELKSVDPDYVGLYYHLAKVYEEMEEYEKALQIYEEGIKVAARQKDFHAVSELNNAKVNLELEM